MKRKRIIWAGLIGALILGCAFFIWHRYMSPTRVLVVNATDVQQADFILNNDSRHISIDCTDPDGVGNASRYDAVILYGRNLYLSEEQIGQLEKAGNRGTLVFTKNAREQNSIITQNISDNQNDTLKQYFDFPNHQNILNGLRYIRHLSTPWKWDDQTYESPTELPSEMFYHREYGQYFKKADELTDYLRKKGLYHEQAPRIALISGLQFPMEGNRAHVDTLISLLTERGYNVYPLSATGKGKSRMLNELHPEAILHMAVGKLGDDELVEWLNQENILLFSPFPLATEHDDWLDASQPVSTGSLNARVVIPEIDGGITPLCIATRNPSIGGYLVYTPEMERVNALLDNIQRHLTLRSKPNIDKRVAIAYFKSPGKDALLATGMEVIPSLYNFLLRLRQEGYNVSGLPTTLQSFRDIIKTDGIVLGSYAKGAQEEYMRKGHPVWADKKTYEQWAHRVLLPEKYQEVVNHYGDAPGSLLTRGDSIAIACVRFGNVLLFPQPRPALGEDDFKLVHGVQVPPPHSYLAPYLYMQCEFQADALIHFGTHGNLEFTPGKQAALSNADWADVLTANLPHFYLYTTGNIGEAVIAKRRLHAELVTYLTPPYAESGMRQKLSPILEQLHHAIEHEGNTEQSLRVKRMIVEGGYHRDLGLDSILTQPFTTEELERIDAHIEELANEKMQGAYYTLGETYDAKSMIETVLAMSADPLAYEMARKDRDAGKITTKQLQDYAHIAHHYLPTAKRRLQTLLQSNVRDTSAVAADLRPALKYMQLLQQSTKDEMNQLVSALQGGRISPVSGGDPVLNPNVLPTGRNMFSINPENTPTEQAWEDGKRLVEKTLEQYQAQHGDYPHQVAYTFWAGEFISTQGATIAQALWMLGVEPVRDGMGRMEDLRLIPADELGRPRINIMVQVSGQLRDIAASRLQWITQAVKMAAEAPDGPYPNYVKSGSLAQEKQLMENGLSPQEAREMSTMRVFGPINNGYSTGIMGYIESSGTWDDERELAEGYLNNMGAMYGDEAHWGNWNKHLLPAALQETDVLIQPRQSNTWGPISLDHVYEFTGALSLAVKTLSGKEPDTYMADYRNRSNKRMQDAREAISVETRSTILNPVFVSERMKGDEGTAQMFGKTFRNIFGWSVTRQSALDEHLYDDLYDMYITDVNHLGIHNYFKRTDPTAFQTMSAVMLESARKGYWKPTEEQLKTTAELHAQLTREQGAACTEFVCNNPRLQEFVAQQLNASEQATFQQNMADVKQSSSGQKDMVLKQTNASTTTNNTDSDTWMGALIALGVLIVIVAYLIIRRRNGLDS